MNDNHTKLHVEPGLFEWMRFLRNVVPVWMTVDESQAAGYPVYLDYTPVVRESELNLNESLSDYYNRSFHVSKTLLSRYPTGIGLFCNVRGEVYKFLKLFLVVFHFFNDKNYFLGYFQFQKT